MAYRPIIIYHTYIYIYIGLYPPSLSPSRKVEGKEGRGRRRKAGGRGREGAQVEWRAGGKGAREAGGRGRQAGGREGRVGQRHFTWGWNWSNVLIPMKVRHWGGGGREGRAGKGRMEGREILPGGGGLIKWRWGIEEGVHLQIGGSGASYPSVPPPMGAGARGREAGGRI